MIKAKISEVFLSYQGEGTFIGSRQLFVRFFGCNMNCDYCDTSLSSYKSFTKEALLSKVLDFEDDYNELVFTGGEPLLYSDFLKEFIPAYRKMRNQQIYLETNGVLFNALDSVLDKIDIVSMDFKLPSSSPGQKEVWREHKMFLKKLEGLEVIAKAVITDTTNIDDIKMFSRVLESFEEKTAVVLQPVSGISEKIRVPDKEMLDIFKAYLIKNTNKNVTILGQFHKILRIR